MEQLMIVEEWLHALFLIGMLVMEFFGGFVLVFTGIKSFVKWLRKGQAVRLELAKGISLALSFKLGGEILRSAIVNDWTELGILGAVVALRVIMTLVIHWEIKHEEEIAVSAED